MDFKAFRDLIASNFSEISKDATHIFEVEVDKDEFWNLYLDSYPEGTNQIYRKRREYDCSCCRHFIKNFGNVVVIKDNKINTIWDINTNDTTFQPVANAMAKYIREHAVTNVYVTRFNKIGTHRNFEQIENGDVITYDHFYVELPNKFVSNSSSSIEEIKGQYRDVRNVFKRSLTEISMDSLMTVLELIASNTLYKGNEWKNVLEEFVKYKKAFDKLTDDTERELFAWEKSLKAGAVIGKIRNHSIGVLLVNISEGMDLDKAVSQYEKIVAPSNYKRPKAIFTQKMLEEAKDTLTEMGYMDSLSRRYATLDDITINNILFSNKDSAKRMAGATDIFSEMAKEVSTKPKKFSKLEEVPVETFIRDILPTANELEVYLENKHVNNMVSLIAPSIADSKTMFKWNNGFSWAYSGNITDSDITQRVKAAGGRTDGVLRFSHSWNYEGMRNASLMDLHVFMPGSNQKVEYVRGKEIHDNYGNYERVGWNHRNHPASGGVQDVDYTAPAPSNYIPVENTTFPSIDRLKEGVYTFKIHNWQFRRPTNGGFKAEIAFGGQVYKFVRKEPLEDKEWVTLAKLELKNGEFKILEMMENDNTPMEIWGLNTNQFVPVSVVCFSPNYWDEQNGIGNKHVFFMLKDCINPEVPNGFFNEFLKEDLMKHKRVFEALGSKMKVADTDDQLSGIGFCMTKRNDLVVKVKGNIERMLKVKF
jgi:hypothetical protein